MQPAYGSNMSNPNRPVLAGLSRVGDYPPHLPSRTINQPMVKGPLNTPIIPGPGVRPQTTDELLAQILAAIKALPDEIARSFRHYYIGGGRDRQDFIVQSQGQITVPNTGVLTSIVSFTNQDNFEGALEYIGLNVGGGNFANILWYIRINGTTFHPGLNAYTADSNTLSAMIPFKQELLQLRKIEIMASQTAVAAGITVEAVMKGYTSYMADWKNWGKAPESGVG